MALKKFLLGNMSSNEPNSFKWWNSKRIEYSLKLLLCLVIAQVIILATFLHLNEITANRIGYWVGQVFVKDIIVLITANIIYFLMPALETVFFKKSKEKYRKIGFGLLNLISLCIIAITIFGMISIL